MTSTSCRESLYPNRQQVYEKNVSISSGMDWNAVYNMIDITVDFLHSLGNKLNFPLHTVMLAQRYFLQYSIFNSLDAYPAEDIAIACIFLACKVQDTSKKINAVLLGAFQLKNPAFENKEIDPTLLEEHRKTVIGYERLVLESISFRFDHELPFELYIQLSRYHHISLEGKTFRKGWVMLREMFASYLVLVYHNAALCVFCLHSCEGSAVMKNRLFHFATSCLGISVSYWNQMDEDYRHKSCMQEGNEKMKK